MKNSWLHKTKRRAREGLLQAVGAHTATEDVEFDIKLKNYMETIAQLNKMKGALELWLESFDLYCAANAALSETFEQFMIETPYSGNPSPYSDIAESISKININMNHIIRPNVRDIIINRCLKPTISILSLVPEINNKIQERKTVMLDFDSYKAKVQREHAAGRDSTHPNVIKKSQKLDESAKTLYSLQLEIIASFDEFEKARPIMMGPELAAFLGSLYHLNNFSTATFGSLLPRIPQSLSTLYILEANLAQSASSGLFVARTDKPVYCEELSAAANSMPLSIPPVLERSEYAGGKYGGYDGRSAVPPPPDTIAASSQTAAAHAVELAKQRRPSGNGSTSVSNKAANSEAGNSISLIDGTRAVITAARDALNAVGSAAVEGTLTTSSLRRSSGSSVGSLDDSNSSLLGTTPQGSRADSPVNSKDSTNGQQSTVPPVHSLTGVFQAVSDDGKTENDAGSRSFCMSSSSTVGSNDVPVRRIYRQDEKLKPKSIALQELNTDSSDGVQESYKSNTLDCDGPVITDHDIVINALIPEVNTLAPSSELNTAESASGGDQNGTQIKDEIFLESNSESIKNEILAMEEKKRMTLISGSKSNSVNSSGALDVNLSYATGSGRDNDAEFGRDESGVLSVASIGKDDLSVDGGNSSGLDSPGGALFRTMASTRLGRIMTPEKPPHKKTELPQNSTGSEEKDSNNDTD